MEATIQLYSWVRILASWFRQLYQVRRNARYLQAELTLRLWTGRDQLFFIAYGRIWSRNVQPAAAVSALDLPRSSILIYY